ncbi:MAG: ComEC/Rec2 family competence protein [Saprospiraceae bacterium]|nr:ComEC/Rec2 family competence protein [Saprospiraceae bacterium]
MAEKLLARPFIYLLILFLIQYFFVRISLMYLLIAFTSVILLALNYNKKIDKLRFQSIGIVVLASIIFYLRIHFHEITHHTNSLPTNLTLPFQEFSIESVERKMNTTKIIALTEITGTKLRTQITLHVSNDSFHLLPGYKLNASITLKKNMIKESIHDFNYAKYLDKNHIQMYGMLDPLCIHKITIQSTLTGISQKINNTLQKQLQTYIKDPEISGLMKAILLGDKSQVTESIKQQFISTGTAHILAVSGMHIGLLYGIIKFFTLRLSKRHKSIKLISCIVTILCVWSFAFITGLGSSIIRATIMFTILELGLNIRKFSDSVNTLCCTSFIMLFYNPCSLYDIGFQLSVFAVLGIILIYPILNRSYRSENSVVNHIMSIIKITLAAQTFITPLSIYYFHNFPTYFIVSNLAWVPLSSILMILGIVLFLLPSGLEIFSHSIGTIIQYLITIGLEVFKAIQQLPLFQIQEIYINELQISCILLSILFIIIWIKFAKVYLIGIAILSLIIFNISYLLPLSKISSTNSFICYSKITLPLVEIKIYNKIIILQSDSIDKGSFFKRKFPILPILHLNYNLNESLIYEITNENKNIRIGIDTVSTELDFLIILNKKYTERDLQTDDKLKIIIHPAASFSIQKHYSHLQNVQGLYTNIQINKIINF